MDELNLTPAIRPGADTPTGGTKREVHYLSFVINGSRLEQLLPEGDYTTPLIEGADSAWYHERLAMLRAEQSGELPSGRVPLLVCGECGDIGCGAVGAFIDVGPTAVTWSGFAYENNYEPADTTPYEIGSLTFARAAYLAPVAGLS